MWVRRLRSCAASEAKHRAREMRFDVGCNWYCVPATSCPRNFHMQSTKRASTLPMTRDYIAAEAARLAALDDAPEWHLEKQAAE